MCLVFLFLLISGSFYAQGLKQRFVHANPPVLKIGDDSSKLGFVGGMRSPAFATVDLDLDGKVELVVKDFYSRRVQVFKILKDDQGNVSYAYAPELDDVLPEMGDFFFFRDYNNDQKPDLLTGSNRVILYINESTEDSVIFTTSSKFLKYTKDGSSRVISFKTSEQPGVALVDDDNLLDLLIFNDDGSRVVFYRNTSTGSGDPTFEIASDKWGYFLESGVNSEIQLGVKKKQGHPGSKILPLDYDNDGDIDLLLSDVSSANVTFLRNGRKDLGLKVDSMVEVIKEFPKDQPIDIPSFPSLSLADFDQDGDLDLVSSKGSTSPVMNGLVWAYENIADNGFDFQLSSKSFMQESMIDVGFGSMPTTFDYDADGDLDLFVSGINHKGSGVFDPQVGFLYLYENVGTPTNPIFQLKDADYMSLSDRSYDFFSATFGDIDNNGTIDLVLGIANGKIHYFKNEKKIGELASFEGSPVILKDLDVGVNARPIVYDVDGDKKNDLLIGESSGNINYWKGKGDGTFEEVSDEWGGVKTNTQYWQILKDDKGEVVDSVLAYLPQGSSKPTIADIDNDGKPDLLVGSTWGRMYLYPELDFSKSTAFVRAKDWFYSPYLNQAIEKDLGSNTAPHLADINNDGKIDLLVGSMRGGVEFYGVDSVVVGIEEREIANGSLDIALYPNPSSGQVNFANQSNEKVSVALWSLSGTLVGEFELTAGETGTRNVSKGAFIVRFTSKQGSLVKRLIVVAE